MSPSNIGEKEMSPSNIGERVEKMKPRPSHSDLKKIIAYSKTLRPNMSNEEIREGFVKFKSQNYLSPSQISNTKTLDPNSLEGRIHRFGKAALLKKRRKFNARCRNPTTEGVIALALTEFLGLLVRQIELTYDSIKKMAQPDNNNTLSSALKTFFEREKLTGDNFNDWYRSLRIVLRVAGTYDYLYKPCPDEPPANAAENVKAAWKAEYKIHSDVACLMLGKMSPALQRQFALYFVQAMLNEHRKMFEKPPAVKIYDLVDTLHSCKQAPRKI
ncbi:hypothetical protein Tco_0444596 [Tanacetum coccineum]